MMEQSDIFLYRYAEDGPGQRRKRTMVYRVQALGSGAGAVRCRSLCEERSRSGHLTRITRSWLWALDVMRRRCKRQVNW